MTVDKFSKLPELAKPLVYDIYLKPCLKSFQFEGKSTIHLDITKKTDFVKLHCNEIDIKSVSLELGAGDVFKNLKVQLDNKWNTLIVSLPKELEPQKAKLNFDYTGQLNNKMQGFSRSSYKDEFGNEKFLASTQFESTYARSAFPCWDEPEYKAVFNVTLEVEDNLTALSNMNVIDEQKTNDGKKIVKFATTPIMSTYLVAFVVGELEYIQTTSKGGIDVRVYTLPGKKEHASFSVEHAAKCLDFYGEWFGIPCPLPKCDLIAVPDFSMGAMENWGLVTYREVLLLFDPARSSHHVKSRIALVISHELAHFWFGNLVTMKWWTDLWLKEGFASFMEYISVAHECPEFNIWLLFLKDEVASGMALDCMRSSHPIEVEINNPNELDEIYDSITYAKSNSINRMLCNYLSEPVFQKGLRSYLKKFQYRNAQTTDLWDSLSKASGQDVEKIMSTWTKQMGFPLVYVEQKINGQKRTLKMKQNRFISDGGDDEKKSVWQVPVEIVTASDPSKPSFKLLLTKPEDEITIDGVKETDWIKLNAATSGFYRVQYSDEMLKDLLPAVESKQMLVTDRFGLANDLFALVASGKISAIQFLQFVKASVNEDEFVVWSSLDAGISTLKNVFLRCDDNPMIVNQFDTFILKCLEPAANRLGWEPLKNEESQTGLLRGLILSRLAKCGHKPTINTALSKFNDYVNTGAELVPDLRGMIFGCVGRSNTKENVAMLQKIFKNCGFAEVERASIMALSQCSDKNLLASVYEWGIKDGNIRAQDLPLFYFGSQGSKEGQDFSYEYFKSNLGLLLEKFGSTNSGLFQSVFKCPSSQCHEAVAKDVEGFCKANIDDHSLQILDRPIKQIVESIRLNEKLLKKSVFECTPFLSGDQA